MLWWKVRTGAKYMFPSIKLLQREYRITQTYPATIPFAWVYHVIAFPIKKLQKGVLQRDIHSRNKKERILPSNASKCLNPLA